MENGGQADGHSMKIRQKFEPVKCSRMHWIFTRRKQNFEILDCHLWIWYLSAQKALLRTLLSTKYIPIVSKAPSLQLVVAFTPTAKFILAAAQIRHTHDLNNECCPSSEMSCPLTLARLRIVLLPGKVGLHPLIINRFHKIEP